MIKRNNATFTARILVYLLYIFLLANVKEQDKLRLKYADSLSKEIRNGEVIQKLVGKVRFEQGETTIKCDSVIQFVNSGKYALIGNVDIYDAEQSLRADTVLIFDKEEIQIARGNVINSTTKDTTFADEITYFQNENKVASKGNVKIQNIKDNTTLTGDQAEYLRTDEIGKIWGRPNYVQYDSIGTETTRIIADTMELYGENAKTIAQNNVKILQRNVSSTCGRAEYLKSDEKIFLFEQPKIQQSNQQIKGDSIRLYLEDSKLKKADIMGNAVAVSDADSLNKGKWENRLTGQKMSLFFEENKLIEVVIENQATSIYHIIEDRKYKGANEISGDRIMIEFADSTATKIFVQSNPDVATGKFLPPN